MNTFRIVRTLGGVKNYLISDSPYDIGTWTRKRMRATSYATVEEAERQLTWKLGLTIPPGIKELKRSLQVYDQNLYYDRPYYNYRMWRSMFDLYCGRTASDATFVVVEYGPELPSYGRVVYSPETESQDMAKHTPLAKSHHRYFFFDKAVATLDEDAAVLSMLSFKYCHLDLYARIIERLISGASKFDAIALLPLRSSTAYAAIARFVDFVYKKHPEMEKERTINYRGDGLEEQPELFQVLLAEYNAIEVAKVAALEPGIRAMYKRIKAKQLVCPTPQVTSLI